MKAGALLLLIAGGIFVLLVLVSGRFAVVPAPQVLPTDADAAQAAWSRVLVRFVNNQGEVDFDALSRNRADLDRYVRFVADTQWSNMTDVNERLAHMINAYNALSMFNVIESGIPFSHAGWRKFIFFVFHKLHIGGQVMSLYNFENDVIRPFTRNLGDPRVHFALNCSAVSCPRLPSTPFSALALDAELERESKAFFAQPQNFRIDTVNNTVWLNEILKFYTEDFVPAQGSNLIEFANRYAPQPAPLDYSVRFTPYDWTIANSRRQR